MLRCIAVEDEPLALDLLEDNISRTPGLELVARCRNAYEAIELLQKTTVDLVFADIQMPGLDGLQMIQSLPQKPMVIFITAYEQYAVDGYSLDVIDYLLKPVTYERFLKACNKAQELHRLRAQATGGTAARSEDRNFIFLQLDYKMVKVMLDEIMMIEALKDYAKIHLEPSRRSMLIRISMKTLEEMLPVSRFIRIHKSYIVSTDFVTAIRRNSVFIGDLELPVSEAYKDNLQRLLGS